MSRETTEANAVARAAAEAWRRHKGGCPVCTSAARRRAWPELCGIGGKLHGEHTEAAAELARNRGLDKMPGPNQQPLF